MINNTFNNHDICGVLISNAMFNLPESLNAWHSEAFNQTLKNEICALNPDLLPLQEGLQHSSYAIADNLSVMVLSTAEDDDNLKIKIGLFYSGVIAGCNCADDPTPVDEITEYCDAWVSINKQTAEATICLVQ